MLRYKSKYINIILAALLISATLFTGIVNVKSNIEKKEYNQHIILDNSNKVDMKETIIDGFKASQRLEIMQINLSKRAKFTEGDWFKKEKTVTFRALGRYYINLEKMDSNNIIVNQDTKTITIFTTLPETSLEFLENETVFSKTEKGLLTIGDLELTLEQIENTKSTIKKEMTGIMNNSENIDTVIEKANTQIESIVFKLTKDTYKVDLRVVR